MPDPRERILFESAPPARSTSPLWFQVTLGVIAGGVVIFFLWFGYQKYQEYRLTRALHAAAQSFQQSIGRFNEESREAAIEHRQRLEAENRARQLRLEQQRLQIEQERIAREARLSADQDRANYMKQLSDPKCQFWLDNLRTTGSEKAKVMVDYHCPQNTPGFTLKLD
jgi:Sec-independent protein translocase protein TatA